MNKTIVYAPIMIPTLCRNEHFIREIESLKRNSWAQYTDVYIALDYPKSESHWEGYNKISSYLENGDFSVFASFNVIKREHNFGAEANSNTMKEYIFEKYDRLILAEDDLEFAPNFLEYMDKCLAEYEDDETVFAINGYSYPIKWCADEGSTVIRQNGCCNAWGIGYWKSKFTKLTDDLEHYYLRNSFRDAVKSGKINDLIPARRHEYIVGSLSGNKGGLYTDASDIAMGIYIGLKNMCVITPVLSKTRNHGFDGSGLYCGKITDKSNVSSATCDYDNQVFDDSNAFSLVCSTENLKKNREILSDYLYISPRLIKRSNILWKLYRIIGQKNTERLFQIIKKF